MKSDIINISIKKTKKNMQKQNMRFNKIKNSLIIGQKIRILLIISVMSGSVFFVSSPQLVQAISCNTASGCQQKINALDSQNTQTQQSINSLAAQAQNYQGAINALSAQISSLQSQIAINQNDQASLQLKIAANQKEILVKKAALADVIKTMYVDGSMSTIEELATSQNLSAYVDKQQYRNAVQNQLNLTLKQIGILQAQMQQQKNQLSIVINSERLQNNQLASDQAKQQQMLAYNQSQQNNFNQQIQANKAQIAALTAEQIAANQRLVNNSGGHVISSGVCGGGYPRDAVNAFGAHWGCNYPLDNTIDNWGMYNQECVSYTAWMVYKTYGYMPYWGGKGNANQWPADAVAAGIPTGTVPKVGSVAIYMGGSTDPWGHAMWVQSVHGNMITVGQYNLFYRGQYYQTTINGSGLTYIYFGG